MNLFIGNLSPQTTEESLRTAFEEFGEVLSVKIPVDTETGSPRGFGFVEMADKFESFDAIDNIDGTYFEGQVITVKESKPKNGKGNNNNRGRGGNHRGGGFRSNNYNRDSGGYKSDDGGFKDPNRQPGRRFSPRGPRPENN